MPKTSKQTVVVVPPRKKPARYFSKAIGNALNVLEVFQQADSPLSLSEVTRRIKLPKSSVFRIIRTLEIAAYLEKLEGDRFALAKISAAMPNQGANQLVSAAQPSMRRLSQEFRETISLAIAYSNRVEVAAVVDSLHRVSMGNVVGDLIPPHASSLGKCIAAYQAEQSREKLLRSFNFVRFTSHTIVDEVTFQKELNLVRTRGYATDLEESSQGGCCVGAPIFDRASEVVGAISISMPKMRFSGQQRLIQAVKEAAEVISTQLRSV